MSVDIVCKQNSAMLRLMKRDRRNEGAPSSSKASGGFFAKRQDDTNHSNTTFDESCSSDQELAAWRAGRFLVDGPPTDADWWYENSDASSFLSAENNAKDSSCVDSSFEEGMPSKRVFRNRGLETWRKTREAWRPTSPSVVPNNNNKDSSTAASKPSKSASKRLSRPISRFRRRELVKNLTSQRQFTLPSQMGLAELVGVYNEIWNEDGSD